MTSRHDKNYITLGKHSYCHGETFTCLDILYPRQHDSTVVALLSAMKCWDRLSPPYASAVIVELFQNGSDFTIEAWYKNGTNDVDLRRLAIPGVLIF